MGWDENRAVTVPQRGKEEAHDYRYFPEPDLPPLVVEEQWVAQIRAGLPELPLAKFRRFQDQYGLSEYDADLLVAEKEVAGYFEAVVAASPQVSPKTVANWITGELFSLLKQSGESLEDNKVRPKDLVALLLMVERGEINLNTAKGVLTEMYNSGQTAEKIVSERGLSQISDTAYIAGLVQTVLSENRQEVDDYMAGKETISRWLFGQVMRAARGQANPQVVQKELDQQLSELKSGN
jgi:aspartyl-tRNA(Asn)/glutamyl-tRNA(Gln) amidotransferase subunit B